MLTSKIKVFTDHGRQVIKNPEKVILPAPYRGLPRIISAGTTSQQRAAMAAMCPTGAIGAEPLSIDMGRCLFCGECAALWPANIEFTCEHRTASTTREGLIITEDNPTHLFDSSAVREVIRKRFRRSLRLRQISAGGDNSSEMELGAAGNVNFDMRRFGIEFTASPRHADGVVITGPMTENMVRAAEITLAAIPEPKVIIVVGADAISGGLFADSPAVDRSFFERHAIDLYVPGHPVHPLNFIWGVRRLIGDLK